MWNKYLIKLNVGGTVYNISAPSEQSAWDQILKHETFYNSEWGYTLLRVKYKNNKLEEIK
tara:strand:- start:585 stop:764 length:180 start_codon:yes stop_codon:yes gene_type:complete